MTENIVVVERPRYMGVLHPLCFPSPLVGAFAVPFILLSAQFQPWGPYLALALMCYFVLLYLRARLVRIELSPKGVTVRNLLRTLQIDASDIAGMEWGRTPLFTFADRCVDILTKDGKRIHVQATVRLRVRRDEAGNTVSRFDDSAIQRWARQSKIIYLSEAQADRARPDRRGKK